MNTLGLDRRHRLLRAGAWAVLAFGVGCMVAAEILDAVTRPTSDAAWWEDALLMVAFAAFPAMGALIALRRPDNLIGWLLLWVGGQAGLLVLGASYARYALVYREGSFPGATLAAWIEAWAWFPLIMVIPTFLLLLFPNGRLPSPRWRPVASLSGVLVVAAAILSMVEERLSGEGYSIPNPIGISGLGDTEETVFATLGPVLLLAVVLCAASLVVRYRSAATQERQQLKWVALAGSAFAVMVPLDDLVTLPGFVFPLLVMGIPVSIAMAVLRYRLYDVDRIISRSVAYALLTSLLVGAYFLSVLVLQSILPLPERSPLIVAASTLLVVAAFGPLRALIQRIVDRRFNRSRYDAALTIESFGLRLRQEVDLEALGSDLMNVVDDSVHPSHLSLWIKPGTNA